jgi:hypothetical protein
LRLSLAVTDLTAVSMRIFHQVPKKFLRKGIASSSRHTIKSQSLIRVAFHAYALILKSRQIELCQCQLLRRSLFYPMGGEDIDLVNAPTTPITQCQPPQGAGFALLASLISNESICLSSRCFVTAPQPQPSIRWHGLAS